MSNRDQNIEDIFEFVADAKLDFHSYGKLTPYDIEEILFKFIEDCYAAKRDKIIVITGKGKVVKPEVEKLLKQNEYVEKFNQAGYFNGQDGAFEVILKNKV